MKGYEDLLERAAWFDLSARGRLRVTGEDRRRLLHAMTTQHVEGMQPGESVYAFFLNAQGRVLADVVLICREEDFVLDLEPEVREKIMQHLDKYIIADDVTVEDITDQTACIAIEGPQAPPPPPSGLVVRHSITGAGGYRVIEWDRSLTCPLPDADAEAVKTVRVEHGIPRYGDDITESHIAQETGQLQALHFSKGCYIGQEIVERVRSRAILHRKLMPLRIAGSAVPPPQTQVNSGADKAGVIYSAVWSPAEKSVRAIGLMRIDFVEGGRPLEVNGTRVEVVP